MRTTRILVAAALVAALGACKKAEEEKKGPDPKVDPKPVALDAGTPVAPAPAIDAAPAATGDEVKPFFYAVEKDGKTAHLLGTMHIGVEPDRLPDFVYATLAKAKTFSMETDLTDGSVIGDLKLPDGKTLEGEIGPEYWKKFEDAVGPQMAAGLKNFKPSAAAALLELRGLPMTMPMDMVLLGKAKDQGATIVYLEEAKLQSAILEKWLDARALKEMLDDLDKNEGKQKEMLAAYIAGDEAAVEKLTTDRSSWKRSPEEYDAMMKELLFDRNASWIPAIEKMIAEGDAFIAVGAAHLIGAGSVLDLLGKKGYKVTRVQS